MDLATFFLLPCDEFMSRRENEKSEIFLSVKTLNHTVAFVRLSNILKLDQQFICFNAEEIFYAFEVE
jgi:hypothetical protein